MDQATKLKIYQAQTENVQYLNKARKQISRTINYGLRKGDQVSVEVQTKLLALLFSAWVEANFYKVLHTPYGFDIDEIEQIKLMYRSFGLGEGWKKCVELGLRKISDPPRSNYVPNARKKLGVFIQNYVIEPSQIRNKIAHGQWVIALNSDNTNINGDITTKINNLNIVILDTWFGVHEKLSLVVKALIESPERAFHRDYWLLISELAQFIQDESTKTIENKTILLKRKPIKRPII